MGNEVGKQSTGTDLEASAKQQDHSEVARHHHIHKSFNLACSLVKSQHDPNDLARELSRILRNRKSSLTPTQRSVLKEYQSGATRYNLYPESRVPEEAAILAYSHLFNVLIFQGQLTNRVTIELNPNLSEDWDGETGVQDGHAIVTLWSQGHIHKPKVRLVRYLGIALQELTNAFMAIYTCMECRRDPTWQGEVDHGEAWKDMMIAIQEAVEDDTLLNLNLKLGGLGISAEGSRPGGALPSQASSG